MSYRFVVTQSAREDPPIKEVAYVGINSHLNAVSVPIVAEGQKDFLDSIHLRNDAEMIRKYLKC